MLLKNCDFSIGTAGGITSCDFVMHLALSKKRTIVAFFSDFPLFPHWANGASSNLHWISGKNWFVQGKGAHLHFHAWRLLGQMWKFSSWLVAVHLVPFVTELLLLTSEAPFFNLCIFDH